MATLLILNYLCFIGLGMTNPLLGAAWPVMRLSLGQVEEALGPANMVMVLGTVIASLLSSRLIRRFGTRRVVTSAFVISVISVLGISFTGSYWLLCLLMVPLGLASGMVDSTINGFIARHYRAIHMNWLHCMWGLGATIGPVIMSAHLAGASGWAGGFRTVAYIQIGLILLLMFTQPMWKRASLAGAAGDEAHQSTNLLAALKLPGMAPAMLAMFCIVGYESLVGVWASSYLADFKGFDPATASLFSSLFFLGITVGRFVTGIIALGVDSKKLIKYGALGAVVSAVLLVLPLPRIFSLIAFLLLGLTCAPLFPAMSHLTPEWFGRQNTQAALGLLMSLGFLGGALMPTVTSVAVRLFSLGSVPWLVLILAFPGYWFSQRIDPAIQKASPQGS